MEKNKSAAKRGLPRRSEKSEIGFDTVIKKAFLGVGVSGLTAIALAAVCAGLCMLSSDPSALTLPIGVAIFVLSSAAGGFLSGRLLSRDRTAALFSGLACGLALTVVSGVSALTQSLLSPESTHEISVLAAVLLRGAAIPIAGGASYFASAKPKVRGHRRR